MSPEFEHLSVEELRQKVFYVEIVQQSGKPYSKSAMINVRSINMQNINFLPANKVFKGKLTEIKKTVSQLQRDIISGTELVKIYDEHFMPNIET